MTTDARRVTYYDDWDAPDYFACVDQGMGRGAVFRLRTPITPQSRWEFLVPESDHWDSVHQRMFATFRISPLAPDEIPSGLPPLPEVPPGPFSTPTQRVLAKPPVLVQECPRVADLARARPDGRLNVTVLLSEDRYETLFGDGCYRYFHSVCLTEATAQRYADAHTTEFGRFHTRRLTIALDGERFVFPGFELRVFDHYEPRQAVAALERELSGTT